MLYGPFTPQECEKAVNWLKEHNIKFEILKDQEKENEFKSSNGVNIIKQAEFRTETFLAQLFYIETTEISADLSNTAKVESPKVSNSESRDISSNELREEFNNLFIPKPEIFPKSLIEKPESLDLKSDIIRSTKVKRFWATLLVIIWVTFFIGYYFSH